MREKSARESDGPVAVRLPGEADAAGTDRTGAKRKEGGGMGPIAEIGG